MLSTVEKTKIIGFLNRHSIDDIYYSDFKGLINRKKTTDSDLFEFLFIKAKESFQKENRNEKLLAKILFLIALLLDIFHKDGIIISQEMCIELLNFKELYEIYKNKNRKEENQDIKSMLEQIEEYLTLYHIKDNQENSISAEELKKLNTKISKLEQTLEKQKIEIEKLTKQNITATSQAKLSDKRIRELRGIKISQNVEIEKLRKEIEKLSIKHEDLNKENKENIKRLEKSNDEYLRIINEQKQKLKLLKKENEELIKRLEELEHKLQEAESHEKLKSKLEDALKELETLKVIIQEKTAREEQTKRDKKREIKVKEIIIKQLYDKKRTIAELQKALDTNSLFLTEEEVYSFIIDLRNENYPINVNSISNNEPKYTLDEPKSFTNIQKTINLDDSKDYIDIMFVSDFHVDFTSTTIYSNYDKLLDYCTENNIHHIVNLGDFFDFTKQAKLINYSRFIKIRRDIDKFIRTLSYAPGIYHFILGGNHDERHLQFKKDFLQDFIEAREDFITLGYENAKLCLQANGREELVELLLSHPNNQLEKRHLREKTNNLSKAFNTEFDFHFFGHSHASFIDIENRVCIIPSFSMDRIYHGATHIRFYINESLDCMDIKPLILERRLMPTSQIIYKNSFDK